MDGGEPRQQEYTSATNAIFNSVTAVVGVGVLGLPHAMAELGWGPGVTVLVLSLIISLYTLWQMVEMLEKFPGEFDRYHKLAQRAFGEKPGLYIAVLLPLIVLIAENILSMVTVGQSLQMFHDTVCSSCGEIKTTYFIIIFGCVLSALSALSHLPNFDTALFSLAAALMLLSYCTIAWTLPLYMGVQHDVQYGYKAKSTAGMVFNFLNALGMVAFAFGRHHVVLAIEVAIRSTSGKESKDQVRRGVVVVYIIAALCYFLVALIGYWIFGNSVDNNILISLEKPAWLIALANMFVVGHATGSYLISAIPMFDMIETALKEKLPLEYTRTIRFIAPYICIAFVMLIAITFPSFGDLLLFFGGALTIYILPCLMRLVIDWRSTSSSSQWKNWMCIAIGVILIVLVPIGALRQIINEAKTYQFYS